MSVVTSGARPRTRSGSLLPCLRAPPPRRYNAHLYMLPALTPHSQPPSSSCPWLDIFCPKIPDIPPATSYLSPGTTNGPIISQTLIGRSPEGGPGHTRPGDPPKRP